MKVNRLWAYARRDALPEDPNAPIPFVASTEGKKADGFDLKMEDWTLDRYARHGVVLWAHDYQGANLPIGTGRAYFEDRTLMIDVAFDPDDEFAQRVRAKTVKGMMAGSVGWNPIRGADGKVRNELLEFSIVPVPMDAAALPVFGARAMQLMTELAMLDESDPDGDPGEAPWAETAAAMVDVFSPRADDTDADRRKRYNALLPKYRRLGKTAPEFLSGAELSGLGPDELRGLFLEGEPDLVGAWAPAARAGAVLSARNRDALEQAQQLIQTVLDSAKKETGGESGESDDQGRAADDESATLETVALKLIRAQMEMM